MNATDLQQQMLALASAEHGTATPAELAHAIDQEARAVDDALVMVDGLALRDSCIDLMLSAALLLEQSGFLPVCALLDRLAAGPVCQESPPQPRRRRRTPPSAPPGLTAADRLRRHMADSYLGDLEVGQLVREVRKGKGLTQIALARLLKCSGQYVSLVELGQTTAKPEWLGRLLDLPAGLPEARS